MQIRNGWTALSMEEAGTLMNYLIKAHNGNTPFDLPLDVLMAWEDTRTRWKACRYMLGGHKDVRQKIHAYRGLPRMPIGSLLGSRGYSGHVSLGKEDIAGVIHRTGDLPLTLLCLHFGDERSGIRNDNWWYLAEKMVKLSSNPDFAERPWHVHL